MNLLPFVAIFLIIITISWNGLFSSYQITSTTEKFLSSYMNIHREIRNKDEVRSYKAKTKPKKSTVPKASEEKKAPTKKPKKFPNPRALSKTDNAKLNIAPLFEGKDAKLEETFSALIKELYAHALFPKDTTLSPADFVKAVLEEGRKLEPSLRILETITLASKEMQEIWYKMLRGCNHFHLQTKEGWPPLSAFVIIHKDKERKPICFKQASIPLLKAHFGEEVSQAILSEEKKRYFSDQTPISLLDETVLKSILTQFGITNGLEHLQFTPYKVTKERLRSTDEKNQIALELHLPPSKL